MGGRWQLQQRWLWQEGWRQGLQSLLSSSSTGPVCDFHAYGMRVQEPRVVAKTFQPRADFFVCSGFFLLLMAQLSSLLSTASSTSTPVLATPIRTSPSLRLDSQPYHPAP